MNHGEIREDEATRSDSEDDDYDDRVHSAPSRKRNRSRSKAKRSKLRKRNRHSEDDILTTDDEDEDDIVDDDSLSSESVEIERTNTGRPRRAVTKNSVNIVESSDDEEINESLPSDDESVHNGSLDQHSSVPRPSLVVKLKAFWNPDTGMAQTRNSGRASRATSSSRPPSRRLGTRHGSRNSNEEDLMELSMSGRHARPVIKKSSTPEVSEFRHPRGAKRIPGRGPVVEASQEGSQDQPESDQQAQDTAAQEDEGEDAAGATQASMAADESGIVAESPNSNRDGEEADNEDAESGGNTVTDDDDDMPVRNRRLPKRSAPETSAQPSPRASKRVKRGKTAEESSDFDPNDAEEQEDDEDDMDVSGSLSPRKANRASRRSSRSATAKKRKRGNANGDSSGDDSLAIDFDELADEARELSHKRTRTRRQERTITYESREPRKTRGPQPDYRIFKPEALPPSDDDQAQPAASYRNRRSAGPFRSLLSTTGPFGGAVGPPAIFGAPGSVGAGAVGGADSDSSDDDVAARVSRNVGGATGMTPTSAAPQFLIPQSMNADPAQGGTSGAATGLGKVKDKKALADADPLGVDQNVNFDGVGGLDNHINQLKEMVALPLLYPEVFQQFKITPPRGVLFHGPPGTGKTLLARALASSVSAQGRKVTFYMRKGADALSKWVGEAERQLRLLFEEARKNQPSIIFFDEIDGLAPVRSSKQEQIHASIVATLLALMDGMDGRGQVIVIGATNRPDSVDPALRRPGRFDREFFFPLPDKAGRRAILDIHTRGWDPALQPKFKDQLAELTKGYGGADLRALCTEAALNAVQGTYPQIYKSNEKLVIDPRTIKIQPKDFMISINKMIPSSERSGGSGGAPIDRSVEPLLRQSLGEISLILDEVLPERVKRTALEEAEYDDRNDENGFEREMLQQEFDRARVYRPRLLIRGGRGMGQQHLGSAVLHKYERLHVQSFDLPTLYNDATRTPEAAVVQLFNEVRRHKPGIIYIPNVNTWYETVGPSVVKVFSGLLRSLPPSDPVLVLGVMELEFKDDKPDENMLRDLFGFSTKNQYQIKRPHEGQRREYFQQVVNMIETPPSELPNPEDRPKRQMVELEVAPAPAGPEGPTKQELKARKKQDMHTLNLLKILIGPIMEHIKNKYKKFRHPTIDETKLGYLFEEQDPNMVTTDVPPDQPRPYELKEDHRGVTGLLETGTGKFYYNIEIVTIERRLSNGYYKRPKDFLADIRRLAKDAKTSENEEKTLKANELVANVEVDIQLIESQNPGLVTACEEVYSREQQRSRHMDASRQTGTEGDGDGSGKAVAATTATQTTGPIQLGERIPGPSHAPFVTPSRPSAPSHVTNGDSNAANGRSDGHSAEEGRIGNSQGLKSQKSALTAMAHNSQLGDYHNSASTTTSGPKTSEKSNHSSERWQTNTQSSNGIAKDDRPDLSGLGEYSGLSEMPDTQEMQHSSGQSQPGATARKTSLGNILNPTDSAPKLILDPGNVVQLHDQLVKRSAGCSVEQLEQINAALMDAVWRRRSSWNRDSVLEAVKRAFNEVIEDIEHMQSILPNSQSTGRSHEPDADAPA